ncbi:hypothetical protein GLYMA_04G142000v4 [Glycine max]|uniref:Uncharacterized protein n=2 Tax=Glycine subgen. Soja TaxID=1462606 RepID=K7KK90_SOYBN|nr:hypothetical protein GLYMA_04G142000v4 [Glycine max]RZC16520.1 hypothetical protein D0Y65_009692 [Glycine soja]
MATLFCGSNPISYPSAFASLRAPPFFFNSPGTVRLGDGGSTSCILFAIVLPSFLLRITILAALRMGDKLDQDWLEEQEMKALMELEKYDDDDSDDGDTEEDNMETNVQEEPTLTQAHSRPKREP